MLNFREELIKTIEPKRGNLKIKKLAEEFLRETLKAIKETDNKVISTMQKIIFICSDVSIIVCLSEKFSDTYSCTSYKEYTRDVYDEIKRKLKSENFVIEEIDKSAFAIIVPQF